MTSKVRKGACSWSSGKSSTISLRELKVSPPGNMIEKLKCKELRSRTGDTHINTHTPFIM